MSLRSSGNVGGFTSIAIKLDGKEIIAYYDATNKDLRYFAASE